MSRYVQLFFIDQNHVYYKQDEPQCTGIRQLFFFDPDGNVIEVSNCSPRIGEIKCNSIPSATTNSTNSTPASPSSSYGTKDTDNEGDGGSDYEYRQTYVKEA